MTRKYTFTNRKPKNPRQKLWDTFSLFIRLRDSNEKGMGQCVSCHKYFHYKEMDAGHYFPKSTHKALEFDERNVNAQCQKCNRNKNYNHATIQLISNRYSESMIRIYDEDIITKLELANEKPRQLKTYEMIALQQEYQKKVDELLEQKSKGKTRKLINEKDSRTLPL